MGPYVCSFFNLAQRGKRVVIATDTALDGQGGALRKTRIVINSKIAASRPHGSAGWIDVQIHITSSFGKDRKSVGGRSWATLSGWLHDSAKQGFAQ